MSGELPAYLDPARPLHLRIAEHDVVWAEWEVSAWRRNESEARSDFWRILCRRMLRNAAERLDAARAELEHVRSRRGE